jgi:hypothetical protein
LRPSTYLRAGLRRALGRRYGYAALRTIRRALAGALARHERLTFGAAPYEGAGELDAIAVAYWRALLRLRRRWPDLNLEDERARP